MSSRRLRILYAIDVLDGVPSGGVVSARRFIAALRAHHDVTVVTTGASGDGRVSLPAWYLPGTRKVMRQMGFAFAVPRREALERLLREADVLHVQFPFWLGARATSLARRAGVPVVASFHVQPENMLHNVGLRSRTLVEWTYRLFLRTVYDLADVVVCPTDFAREQLSRRGLRAPAEVVSNGVVPTFRPAASKPEHRDGDPFLLLTVGRLAPEKRVDVVIEGVRRSRYASRIQLVVAGRGPDERRIRRLGASLPVPARVEFVDDASLVGLLSAADLLVHASEIELEGMAVLEALGCGTPALVADAPLSATRHLALGDALRFRAGDPSDLAGRLDALLADPAALARWRPRALDAAAALSFEASLEKLEAIYRRVVEARAPRGTTARPARSAGEGAALEPPA